MRLARNIPVELKILETELFLERSTVERLVEVLCKGLLYIHTFLTSVPIYVHLTKGADTGTEQNLSL